MTSNRTYTLFLNSLEYALKNKPINWKEDISEKEWRSLFRLASIHDVVPLFVQTVYECSSLAPYQKIRNMMIRRAKSKTINQAQKTASFILLYHKMVKEGLKPLVMKGIICRSLYSNPEQRPSSDEDLLIFPYQIDKYHTFLTENGFQLADPNTDILHEHEVSYMNPDNHLYLELHKYLFPVTGSAYSDLNSLFSVLEERKTVNIYSINIKTFGYTDHFLYMICHAYKHFLYSGIGIRQICDICLFAQKYGLEIDWDRIFESCKLVRMDYYMVAIMNICVKYLGLQTANLKYSSLANSYDIDETPLLEDILSGGLYGTSSRDRLHSSTITLEVVVAQKEGRKPSGLIKTIFPSTAYMIKKYPFIKKYKWLLPIAWLKRWRQYLINETKKKANPIKTIEIGNNRIALLRNYHIID